MSELEIPERAYEIAADTWTSHEALKVAAPIIVAAELRRLFNDPDFRDAPRTAIHMRADELDPPAVNP